MTQRTPGRRALVTGGAGLIGSHLSDLLLREGYSVRILDNLEPQTHRKGKPPWIPREAEFLNADIRDRAAVVAALADVDVVYHQAAYGGYMPEMAKYVHVNSFGTAQMLEIIRDENLPVRKSLSPPRRPSTAKARRPARSTASSSRRPDPPGSSRPGTSPFAARSLAAANLRRRPRLPRRPRRGARPSTPSPSQTRNGWCWVGGGRPGYPP
jgi:nucleoside-diphosphate-sugar epimerase